VLAIHSIELITICEKTEKINIMEHQKIYTEEKPYQYEVCNKLFSRNFDLKLHHRTHTRKKPYQCNVWGNSFIQNNDAIRHQRTHTGEKPYQCDVC